MTAGVGPGQAGWAQVPFDVSALGRGGWGLPQ